MKRIFIVEDDTIYAQFLKKSLEKEKKYSIQVFHTAEACLTALDSQINPNIILIDYFLPGMSGMDLYRNLKRLKGNTLMIMLSSNTDGNLVVDIVKQGIRNYVMKDENVIETILSIIEENTDRVVDLHNS